MARDDDIQAISVLVPQNPFVRKGPLRAAKHCLAALNVDKLMEWWPGKPHEPDRDATKIKAIQRSLDWKRVAQIAAYLLQEEIEEAPDKLEAYFAPIYEPSKYDPGRTWPPKIPRTVGYEKSAYPTFSNVLIHVNGAKVQPIKDADERTATLIFSESSRKLNFSVIDGQHRINGAYFAVRLLRERRPEAEWEIPAEVFLNLDKLGAPPRHQAQIFIDVNFYQKKVDRSLVADLFPTTRGDQDAWDDKERAQDIGRKLMLEIGPLKGMIQIPGIKFGASDVIALATLNSAIEDQIAWLHAAELEGLEEQAEFIGQLLEAWLDASGRRQELKPFEKLHADSVVYQGRVIGSVLTLIPAALAHLEKRRRRKFVSEDAQSDLTEWFGEIIRNAGLVKDGRFIGKPEFKTNGFLGSGGIGRFRDRLWAATRRNVSRLTANRVEALAEEARAALHSGLLKK
jgi:DGQHR domain-containing protein